MKVSDFEKSFKPLDIYNSDAFMDYQRINILDKNEKPGEIIADKKGVCVRITTRETMVIVVLTAENLETLTNELKQTNDGTK